MDPPHRAKLLSLYERGIVTAPEIASGLLIDLIKDDGLDPELPSFVACLPAEVRRKLRDLLQQAQQLGHSWTPSLLGPGGSVLRSAADDSIRLRRLGEVLGIDRATADSLEPENGGGM